MGFAHVAPVFEAAPEAAPGLEVAPGVAAPVLALIEVAAAPEVEDEFVETAGAEAVTPAFEAAAAPGKVSSGLAPELEVAGLEVDSGRHLFL